MQLCFSNTVDEVRFWTKSFTFSPKEREWIRFQCENRWKELRFVAVIIIELRLLIYWVTSTYKVSEFNPVKIPYPLTILVEGFDKF